MHAYRRHNMVAVDRYLKPLLLAVCTAFGASAVVLIYPVASKYLFHTELADPQSLYILAIRWILVAPVCALLFSWWVFGWHKVNDFLHRRRFLIGALIIALFVILNINNSSLGYWDVILGKPAGNGLVFGTPRSIRSDEFIVNTPLAFSQRYNGYAYFSTLFGNRTTDMFIIKDAPVWTAAEIFRPFHWGYLLLGSERGLAFYSSARLVVLFLVSYQFFLLITKSGGQQNELGESQSTREHRGLSLIGAALVACAPVVQWWYAVNGLVEMIIATFLSVLLFSLYLRAHQGWKRFALGLGIMLCAGMFILTLYPAWQIPLIFILLILVAWLIVTHWGTIAMRPWDWASVIVTLLVFSALMLTVLRSSLPTIQATMNTVYPGSRESNGGGGQLSWLFSTMSGLAFPFREFVATAHASGGNSTEASSFVTFFPLGIVLAGINLVRGKGKDILAMLLLVIIAFLGLYIFIGFPPSIAAVTGMSHTTVRRALVMFELANVILLIRAVSHMKFGARDYVLYGLVTVICLLQAFGAFFAYRAYLGYISLAVLVVFSLVTAGALITRFKVLARVCTLFSVALLVLSGISVNPIQYSASPLTGQPAIEQVESIQRSAPGQWIVVGGQSSLLAQLMVANGIPTSNALSVTPNMQMWKILDKNGSYAQEYNRYAYMNVMLVDRALQPDEKMLTVTVPDRIDSVLNLEQLHRIGVRYILAAGDIEHITYEHFSVHKIGSTISGLTPYEIVEGR